MRECQKQARAREKSRTAHVICSQILPANQRPGLRNRFSEPWAHASMRSVRIARLPLSLCLRPPRVRPTYRPVSMSAAGEKRPRLEGEAADASASGKQVIATERAPRAIGPYRCDRIPPAHVGKALACE